MPDTTNQIKVSGNVVVNTTVFPDTKLQTLDRRVGKDQLYFDRKLFEASVEDWSGIPIIYQPDGVHPSDFTAVDTDPVSAAEAIGGKLVGSVSNPRIVVPGGPRLMAELDIDENEREIVGLWQQGKLFPSTAFMASSDGDRLTSPPVPNHVLLFPVRVDEVLPGDLGAFVNTLEVQSTMTCDKDKNKTCTEGELPQAPVTEEPVPETPETVSEEEAGQPSELDLLRAEIEQLKAEIAGLKQAAEEPEQIREEPVANTEEITAEAAAEVVSGIDEEIKWRDEEIAALKAEVEAMKAGKAALEEKLKGLETAAAEAEFNTVLEKLPVGMKATPDQVALLHTQFMEGNTKAMLYTLLNTPAQSGATQRIGQPFTQSNTVAEQFTVGDLNKPRNRN